MIVAIARHMSLVAGFAGSLAAIIPGFLLWPQLGHGAFTAPVPRAYAGEIAIFGAITLMALLGRVDISLPLVWAACGFTTGFAVAAGGAIAALYAPAGGLFALSGALRELGPGRAPLLHVLVAVGAALLQFGLMAGLT